jgi:hypothetical protein
MLGNCEWKKQQIDQTALILPLYSILTWGKSYTRKYWRSTDYESAKSDTIFFKSTSNKQKLDRPDGDHETTVTKKNVN